MNKVYKLTNPQWAWAATLLLFVLWIVAEVILVRWGHNNLPIQRTMQGYTKKADLIFMGNSRVAAGIKPSLIAADLATKGEPPLGAYNLGIGSSPIGIHYLILKRLIEEGKQPHSIVYGFIDNELTRTDFTDDYNIAEMSKPEDFPLLLTKSLSSIDSRMDLVAKKLSHLYRYRFHIREVLTKSLSAKKVEVAQIKNNENGFQDFKNIVREDAIQNLQSTEESRYKSLYFDEKQWTFVPKSTYLEEIVNLCKQNKIKLVFVAMPVTKLHRNYASRSIYYADYLSALKTYLNDSDLKIIDMSSMMEDQFLPDTFHLSGEGATLFSHALAQSTLRDWIFKGKVKTESR
jgi:hypothetical protein